MRRYLTLYRKYFKEALESGVDPEKLLEYHLRQIEFFQHERLIHLIVTLLFALATVMTIIATAVTNSISFAILTLMLLCLLIPYIAHYFFLENQVQYMYDDYNKLYIKIHGFGYASDTEKKAHKNKTS